VKDCLLFYNTFLNITTDPVFKFGDWTYLTATGTDSSALITYGWQYGNEKRLVVVNFSNQTGMGDIVVSNAEPVNGNDTIPVTDLLTGDTYWRSAKEMRTSGLSVIVDSWYAQIFQY